MSDDTLDPAQSPDEPLTTGPVLSEADDAFVAGLLAASGAVAAPVPADVAARWDAALEQAAAERNAVSPAAASTVIPMQRAASRAPRGARWAGIAASVAALALFGGVIANQFGGDSAADSTVPEATVALPTTDKITTSGTAFSAQNVKAQAATLVGEATGLAPTPATLPKTTEVATASTVAPGAGTAVAEVAAEPEVKAFLDDADQSRACVENLAQRKGVRPVALDMGYFRREPAAMVVLVAEGDPTKVDVFIVGTDCNQTDADVLYFTRVSLRP